MSSPEGIPQETAPIDPEWLRAQIANLKKIGLLLLVVCLVLSVCLNVYVICANASIRYAMKDYLTLADNSRTNDMFVKRLLMDLQALSEDHEAVRGLLVKYGMAAPSPGQQSRDPSVEGMPPAPKTPRTNDAGQPQKAP